MPDVHNCLQGGAFDGYSDSPFGIGKGEGVDRRGDHADEWIVSRERYKYDEIFEQLGPVDGKISVMSREALNFGIFTKFLKNFKISKLLF